ncbi:MAG: YccF domain-containing protein [Pseudomonadota bacterium]|nr:YccF domain-containing protein [Pseudomonadota bacterium]
MMMILFILNVLWFLVGGGLIACLLWFLSGGLLFLTVVGIPFAFAAFRIARFTAFPFGRELVEVETPITGTAIANFIWILLAGIWLFIAHIVAAGGFFITIIGIPFGWAHFKLALASFAPLGKQIVAKDAPH